eukprot:2446748-Prymnesium_polylepis.1
MPGCASGTVREPHAILVRAVKNLSEFARSRGERASPRAHGPARHRLVTLSALHSGEPRKSKAVSRPRSSTKRAGDGRQKAV